MERALAFVVAIPFLFSPFACTIDLGGSDGGNGGDGGGGTNGNSMGLSAHCQNVRDNFLDAMRAFNDDPENGDLVCPVFEWEMRFYDDCCDDDTLADAGAILGPLPSGIDTCAEAAQSVHDMWDSSFCADR